MVLKPPVRPDPVIYETPETNTETNNGVKFSSPCGGLIVTIFTVNINKQGLALFEV